MTNSELKDRLVDAIALLSVPGVGRARYHRLVKAFGSAAKALSARTGELEAVSGVSATVAANIKSQCDMEQARQMATRTIQLGWTVLFPDDPQFPRPLLNIPETDIPAVLFAEGTTPAAMDNAIAIVGTRRPTEQGKLFAYNLASALASAGITVVSGMAEGVDTAAHRGALEAGGKTVAVWGSSLDMLYPPSNKALARDIKLMGTTFSEYFPGTAPDRAHFPERNRIISGLSQGVVVVEAGKKSGALITASLAVGYGRELFAVPGHPSTRTSEGTNALIKQGAKLLTEVDDIFDELPRLKGNVLVKKYSHLPDMTSTERQIVKLFSEGPQQIDQISRAMSLPVPELMGFLLALEMKGVVKELSGKRFILSEDYS